jgi:hypothetical protein
VNKRLFWVEILATAKMSPVLHLGHGRLRISSEKGSYHPDALWRAEFLFGREARTAPMSDTRDDRIERCRRLIAGCRAKIDGLTPKEKQAVLQEIESYERLIDCVQRNSMNASQSAETYARPVAGLPTVEEKIDRLARAIVELALAVQGIERRLERVK